MYLFFHKLGVGKLKKGLADGLQEKNIAQQNGGFFWVLSKKRRENIVKKIKHPQ